MTFKNMAFRVATVLTVVAFAAPALPCDATQTHATTSTPAPTTTGAPANTSKDAVAKQTPRPDKGKQQSKPSTATKPTASN